MPGRLSRPNSKCPHPSQLKRRPYGESRQEQLEGGLENLSWVTNFSIKARLTLVCKHRGIIEEHATVARHEATEVDLNTLKSVRTVGRDRTHPKTSDHDRLFPGTVRSGQHLLHIKKCWLLPADHA